MVKYARMEENKRVYEEQYDTDEYEALTCECHHQARAKELNGSRRKPFFCIYCKAVYKDKNKLNLHRLEGCFAVKGDGRKTVLKIYPMFGKGQRGEIEDILIKHGLMNPRKKPSRAKRKKSAAAAAKEDTELTPLIRPQKLKARGMLSSSSSLHEAQRQQQQQSSSKDSESLQQISYGGHRAAVDQHPNSGSDAVAGDGDMQVQMQLTREQVEAQAREAAKAWDAYLPSARPDVVPCPGLYHLMQFQLLPSDFPGVRDDSFLHAFFEFVDTGQIDPALRSSYGTWYMERETDADDEEQRAVKLTMSRFKLVAGRPDLLARLEEKTAVQAFLQYQKECAQYEAAKEAAEKELHARREGYVKEKLHEFDSREQAHKELAVWHWSPLLHILKSDGIGGVPLRPWSHSDAEQNKIVHAILMNRGLGVAEPPHCPLIVRMFKIVYLYCFDKNSTLSDPITGLLRETMLGYSTSESAVPVLRISAQSVLNEGCFLFANLPPYTEAQTEVFQDINALLHGSAAEREVIVQKVQGFLRVVRQRAAGDMAQLHPDAFRVLWCGGDGTEVADALKKFSLCLKMREDLDMGWVPFPSGHPDCDSVAVMQARDAVFKAIHKLHDLRVLADKTRLLAAASPSPADVGAHEKKFQALVETCVVKSHSANGSPDKHSSYSTSGSAEDSRSSHEQKQEAEVRPRKPSPDLNLNLDSNDSYSPASPTLTAHMAGLHVAKLPKTVSVMGVEVQTSDTSHFPFHFYGPGSEALRPCPDVPSLHPNRVSDSSFGAESSASVSQGL